MSADSIRVVSVLLIGTHPERKPLFSEALIHLGHEFLGLFRNSTPEDRFKIVLSDISLTAGCQNLLDIDSPKSTAPIHMNVGLPKGALVSSTLEWSHLQVWGLHL